jgi:hypothetical protein
MCDGGRSSSFANLVYDDRSSCVTLCPLLVEETDIRLITKRQLRPLQNLQNLPYSIIGAAAKWTSDEAVSARPNSARLAP